MNNTVKLQRQCVQLGSINCESVSPALQMKVAAGALDKPQIKGMVLQVLTTDCCALLIPPGCFFFFFFSFRSCLCHCWWNETVPAAHSGWIWARVHLLQDGTSISTSTFSGVWWVIKNRTGRSLICSCVRKNKVSFCARLWPNCQIQNPQGAGVLQWDRHRAAGLMSCWCLCSVMGASCLDTLISAKFSWLCVILQWSGKKHLLSECEPQMWVIRTFGIKIIMMATVKLLTFIQECIPLSYSVPDNLNLWLHLSWPTHSDHHS